MSTIDEIFFSLTCVKSYHLSFLHNSQFFSSVSTNTTNNPLHCYCYDVSVTLISIISNNTIHIHDSVWG